jgi:hypothetical protein
MRDSTEAELRERDGGGSHLHRVGRRRVCRDAVAGEQRGTAQIKDRAVTGSKLSKKTVRELVQLAKRFQPGPTAIGSRPLAAPPARASRSASSQVVVSDPGRPELAGINFDLETEETAQIGDGKAGAFGFHLVFFNPGPLNGAQLRGTRAATG